MRQTQSQPPVGTTPRHSIQLLVVLTAVTNLCPKNPEIVASAAAAAEAMGWLGARSRLCEHPGKQVSDACADRCLSKICVARMLHAVVVTTTLSCHLRCSCSC